MTARPASTIRRSLLVHPLRHGAVDAHERWCDEVRARRDEFGESRRAAGIVRHVSWLQPAQELAVLRVDAADPAASLEHLAASDTVFDRWYGEREREVHGGGPLEFAEPPEVLADYADDPVDPFDLFVAAALPLLPGRADAYRERIASGRATGDAMARVRRWGIKRMSIWLHHVRWPDGADTDGHDVVIYELAGDIPQMFHVLATDDTAEMDAQRALLRDAFGVDVAAGEFPVPLPSFAWSAPTAASDGH